MHVVCTVHVALMVFWQEQEILTFFVWNIEAKIICIWDVLILRKLLRSTFGDDRVRAAQSVAATSVQQSNNGADKLPSTQIKFYNQERRTHTRKLHVTPNNSDCAEVLVAA